jgi:hypothetical protein
MGRSVFVTVHSSARATAVFVATCLVVAAVLAIVGLVIALLRDGSARDSVAYALCIGGGAVALMTGLSGSPSVRDQASREVVGGRFVTPVVPLPSSSLVWALVGFACIGIGVLMFVT